MRIKRFLLAVWLCGVAQSAPSAADVSRPFPIARQETGCSFDLRDVDLFGPPVVSPDDAVWRMLLIFAEESVVDYTNMMTEDFLFTSNDQAFMARFPCGMSRADEDSFATHLFEGGGRGPRGEPLPTATRILLDVRMDPSKTIVKDAQASVRVDWCRVRAMLSNGDTLDFGNTQLDFELAFRDVGWRVRRWVETVLPESPAARPVASNTGKEASKMRLALRARPQPRRGIVLFDLVLPKPGAVLEMFDVMGRRITQRDLSDLVPGRHTVALDGGGVPAGVYWARVRQDQAAVVAKVIWVK